MSYKTPILNAQKYQTTLSLQNIRFANKSSNIKKTDRRRERSHVCGHGQFVVVGDVALPSLAEAGGDYFGACEERQVFVSTCSQLWVYLYQINAGQFSYAS